MLESAVVLGAVVGVGSGLTVAALGSGVLFAAFAAVCLLAAVVALASTTLRRVGLGTPHGV
ncbi:hypothetical protein [Streptomyces sp. NPDC088910]|uniref:hypothetical protein n=1 Tax=Streptomyces sp. NPDC088910 TaxID=3365911 RepID=UPI0037F5730E